MAADRYPRHRPECEGRVAHAGQDQVMIALKDVALEQQQGRWTGKLDVYVVQRDEDTGRASSSGDGVQLALKESSYESAMKTGFAYERSLNAGPKTKSLRVIVYDENSGRFGSVTLPAISAATVGSWITVQRRVAGSPSAGQRFSTDPASHCATDSGSVPSSAILWGYLPHSSSCHLRRNRAGECAVPVEWSVRLSTIVASRRA